MRELHNIYFLRKAAGLYYSEILRKRLAQTGPILSLYSISKNWTSTKQKVERNGIELVFLRQTIFQKLWIRIFFYFYEAYKFVN